MLLSMCHWNFILFYVNILISAFGVLRCMGEMSKCKCHVPWSVASEFFTTILTSVTEFRTLCSYQICIYSPSIVNNKLFHRKQNEALWLIQYVLLVALPSKPRLFKITSGQSPWFNLSQLSSRVPGGENNRKSTLSLKNLPSAQPVDGIGKNFSV